LQQAPILPLQPMAVNGKIVLLTELLFS